MTETDKANWHERRRLDLLVDGELSDGEVRELLSSLEEDPGGWRRCAMAFLEAQAWGRDLAPTIEEERREAPIVEGAVEPRTAARQLDVASRRTTTYVSAAAVLLLAFAAGALGAGDRLYRWAWPTAPEIARPKFNPPDSRPPEDQPLEEPNWVTFYVNDDEGDGGGVQQVQLPLLDLNEEGERWLRRNETAPQGMRELLRQLGQEVGDTRKFVEPVRLNDGRRVLVPMEQWEIVPISQKSYQ